MSTLAPVNDDYLKVTNFNALKSRNSLVSVASVRGGGSITTPLPLDSTTVGLNPLLSSKEIVNIDALMPQGLLEETQDIIALLEQYYTSENTDDNSGISTLINTLFEKRNVDAIEADEDFEKWFFELSNSFFATDLIKFDRRTFLKYYTTLLRQKGSTDGIKSFFRILYDKNVNVYVPWEDVLIASNGYWNGDDQYRISLDGAQGELKGFVLSKGAFTSNKGFLSDRIYLQDSFYYQQYSYDVQFEEPKEAWERSFKSLMHPSGFILFTTLILLLTTTSGKMPYPQYGKIENVIRIVEIILANSVEMLGEVLVYLTFVGIADGSSSNKSEFSSRFLFNETVTMEEYGDLTLDQLINGNYNASSYIVDSSLP